MAVSFQLDPSLERDLRTRLGDLDRIAKENVLVELYRRGKLSLASLRRELGIPRTNLDAFLKQHEVHLAQDIADVVEESEGLRQLRGGLGHSR